MIDLGLGCMRLSTEAARDDGEAHAILTSAIDAGYTHLDTARAYAVGETDAGHNERLVAAALAARPEARSRITVVTKVGMRRDGGAWIPDGRAKTIREHVAASAAILGAPIDLVLDHAPDRKTDRMATVRALLAAQASGVARAIGLSNPTLAELEAACALGSIAAIEIALGAFEDAAARGGMVELCARRGIVVLAHSPLGGPKRAGRLKKHAVLAPIAAEHGVSAAAVFLAYLARSGREARVVPLVGVRRRETMLDAIAARSVALDDAELARLDDAYPGLRRTPRATAAPRPETDVVVVMGIPGAGKSTFVESLVRDGYERLNRDLRGGTLRELARHLDERLAAGATRLVLDNTYLARAQRADVIDAAHRHRAAVRCIHVATPLAVAQVQLCERMIERFGVVLDGEAITQLRDPAAVMPLVPIRAQRDLEVPRLDEGFAAIETVVPPRRVRADRVRSGVAVSLDYAAAVEARAADAWLLFGWDPALDDATARVRAGELAARVGASVEVRICRHAGGPPRCWCRSPQPGLLAAFVNEHAIDPAKLVVVGGASARTLASAFGAVYAER